MKLEKVLNRPKKGIWVFFFILGLVVVGVMATSYNVEILRELDSFPSHFPLLKVILGVLGFIGILVALITLFARLLREMKVSQIQAEFLDRISHELRTPLSTLTLVSDLLKEEVSKEEVAQLWKAHELELNRLKLDVELLLQAAHLRESKWNPEVQTLNLEHWLSERWENFKLVLGTQAKMERWGEPLLEEISIDPSLLEMIFRNLLDNARKFSLGEPVVIVKSEIFSSGFIFKKRKWRISVTDQGVGFQQRHRGQLFKRFSRLPQGRSALKSSSIPGTGLGLYLSAMASKAMGLTLTGQSGGEGKGAQFILEGNCR